MADPGPRIDRYRWAGGAETRLRFGPDSGPRVVAVLPLFEEANRTRAMVVAILRALADRGIGSILPDLPAQGESLIPTADADLAVMRAALAASRDGATYSLAVRSGALIDTAPGVTARWQFSPMESGMDVLRDLARIRTAAGIPTDAAALATMAAPGPLIAGNRLSPAFLAALADARADDATPRRVVRLDSDPRAADRTLPGAPPWRQSEPGRDSFLVEALADDIADWVAACERR